MSNKNIKGEGTREVLLRTSADVASHALGQIEALANEYPEYKNDATTIRQFVERLVVKARVVGYIDKRGANG